MTVEMCMEKFGSGVVEVVLKQWGGGGDSKYSNKIFREDTLNVLRIITFIKQKRCGRIKYRNCADWRKWCVYISKECAVIPIRSAEVQLVSWVPNVKEDRRVVTCDIDGVFLRIMTSGWKHTWLCVCVNIEKYRDCVDVNQQY